MTLEDLGYNADMENYRQENKLDSFVIGRIISEHKERYIVKTADKEYDSEIIGNLRFTASSRSDFPAVGDWVAVSEYNEDNALIHAIFPRKTIIERQAVGKQGENQIIATNIDFAFILQAVDRDFNINRIERYLTICYSSEVKPFIILTKTDLIGKPELDKLVTKVKDRIKQVPVIAISNENLEGINKIQESIQKGGTYCLLGSSGVGKSTLANNMTGRSQMETDAISSSTNKGRHITSHRELLLMENGGILIDNPGMREVGVTDTGTGLEKTFDRIMILSENCKFSDCTHTTEIECAILKAVEEGEIDRSSYDNYLKMEKEKAHYESTVAEKRRKDKDFGKMLKGFKKDMKKFSSKHKDIDEK